MEIHSGEWGNLNGINISALIYLQQPLLADTATIRHGPGYAGFVIRCSPTTPLKPQRRRTRDADSERVSWCAELDWEREREGIEMHIRHKTEVQRHKMNSKASGKKEKHDHQFWGGRWYSPGLFLASGIHFLVELCLTSEVVLSTEMERKWRTGWLVRDGATYLQERETAGLGGNDQGQGRKSYKRRERKNAPVLLYGTEKGFASIQRDLTLLSSHRQAWNTLFQTDLSYSLSWAFASFS